MSKKTFKPITLQDLGLSPKEKETFAKGSSFLFGPEPKRKRPAPRRVHQPAKG